jgi:hypothetical protein
MSRKVLGIGCVVALIVGSGVIGDDRIVTEKEPATLKNPKDNPYESGNVRKAVSQDLFADTLFPDAKLIKANGLVEGLTEVLNSHDFSEDEKIMLHRAVEFIAQIRGRLVVKQSDFPSPIQSSHRPIKVGRLNHPKRDRSKK